MGSQEDELSRAFSEAFFRACKTHHVPDEAVRRLLTPDGEQTLAQLAQLVYVNYLVVAPRSFPVGYRGTPKRPGRHAAFLVPNLSAAHVLARVKREACITYFDSYFVTWDFCQSRTRKVAHGQTHWFEALTWTPGRKVSTADVREHFEALGADADPAVFLAWIAESKPVGFHVAIPRENELLCPGPAPDRLRAPYFHHEKDVSELYLADIDRDWDDFWTFVAFRAVP